MTSTDADQHSEQRVQYVGVLRGYDGKFPLRISDNAVIEEPKSDECRPFWGEDRQALARPNDIVLRLTLHYKPEEFAHLISGAAQRKEELRPIIRGMHVALRMFGKGDVSIPSELARYCGLHRSECPLVHTNYRNVFRPNEYTLPPENWAAIGDVLQDLEQLRLLGEINPFSRFAETVFRYYHRDRFEDYVICLDGLLLSRGTKSTAHKVASKASYLLRENFRGDQQAAYEAVFLWYKLRNEIVHGARRQDYDYMWRLLDLADLKEGPRWNALCAQAELNVRDALKRMLGEKALTEKERHGFWIGKMEDLNKQTQGWDIPLNQQIKDARGC